MRLSLSSLRRAPLVVALVAATAACGSSPSTSNEAAPDRLAPADAVRAAAATTQEAGSSRFALTSSTEVQGESVEFSGEGVYDPATKEGSATFTLPGGAGEIEQRFVGDDLYMSVPGQDGFFRLSLRDLVGTELATAAQPTGALEALESVADVEEVGTESVRGTETTHYRGTLDAEAALEQLGGSAGELAEQGLGEAGLDTVPFEVWIDDEGRTRRFRSTLDITASDATGGQAVSTTTTVELFDFGVDVDVEPPPADQVQDGSALLEGLAGTAGS